MQNVMNCKPTLTEPAPHHLEENSPELAFCRLMEETMEVVVELWSTKEWVRYELPRQLIKPGHRNLFAVDLQTVFTKDFVRSEPFVSDPESHQSVLFVPFDGHSGQPLVAVAKVDRDDSPALLRMSRLCLRQYELETELRELREENEQFLLQSTHDIEELTFLRQLCSFLELRDRTYDIDEFLEKIGLQIKSEWVVFVADRSEKGPDGATIPFEYETFENPLLSSGFDLEKELSLRSSDKVARRLLNQFSQGGRMIVENSVASTTEIPGIGELLISPVVKEGRRFGWLLAVNRIQNLKNDISFAPTTQKSEFGSYEAGLLTSASAMLATHFSNLELFSANKQLVLDVVRSLVAAIDSKDAYTCGHSERVAQYGRELGRAMGLDTKSQERLYLSGLLHDVGKIGISDAILGKPGRPTDAEFAEIMKHPEEGWKILKGLRQLESILDGVLFHHERFDGRGYPDGLESKQIPLDGRILAVADSFDAMTSDRPYRNGMSVEKAYEILRDGAGTQWDASIIETFLQISHDIEQIKDEYQPAPCPTRRPKTAERLEG